MFVEPGCAAKKVVFVTLTISLQTHMIGLHCNADNREFIESSVSTQHCSLARSVCDALAHNHTCT
eukprot:m.212105 g.212105  ORF g.212105 m.212105 type:complete len:65 (+) comp15071_c0_seq1:1763-1957(+)